MSENAIAVPARAVAGAEPAGAASRRWWILVLVCLGQFMVVLDATIVNVALPTIESALGLTTEGLQWIVNAYTLTFGGFLLLGGRMADLLGRKRLFIAGVALFSLASVACGLADSEAMLIAARAVQGLGGALVSPAALSIVTTTFAEGAERTRALSVWAAIAVGGGAAGLLFGGMLTEWLDWRWVFFVNTPIGVLGILGALRLIPESRQEGAARHFDLLGATTVTVGLALLVFGITKTESWGWGAGRTIGVLLGALALLAAFVVVERRSPSPLVRLGIFRLRSLTGANSALLVVAGGLFGIFFFNTLYLQGTLGYTPLRAGLAFLPVTFGVMAASGLAGRLAQRLGARPVLGIGLLVAAAGLGLLTQVSVDGTYLADVLPGSLLMAFGLGLAFVPLTLAATANVENEDAGLASGIMNTSQQIGGALGLAVLSTLAADRTASFVGPQAEALVAGYQRAYLAGAILLAVGALLALLLLRRVAIRTGDAPAEAPIV
jgi:EmrB/QacA subfamily drug resistance transporter